MKKLFSVIVVIALLAGVTCFAYAAEGDASGDVPSPWAQEEVAEAVSLGFVPDELQSRYRENIRRREFCRLAVDFAAFAQDMTVEELIGSWEALHGLKYEENVFTDTNDYYVNCAYDLHIVRGRGDGVFAPDEYITRQEAASMLLNVFFTYGSGIKHGQKSQQFEIMYSDAGQVADWAYSAVLYMFEWNVLKGDGGGKFDPAVYMTREQAAVTFLRLYPTAPGKSQQF